MGRGCLFAFLFCVGGAFVALAGSLVLALVSHAPNPQRLGELLADVSFFVLAPAGFLYGWWTRAIHGAPGTPGPHSQRPSVELSSAGTARGRTGTGPFVVRAKSYDRQFAWLSAVGPSGLRTLGLRESAARFETEVEARAAIQSHMEGEDCRGVSFEIMAAE
jgi:hypothetical protein